MDPSTGEVFDSHTGESFESPDAMMAGTTQEGAAPGGRSGISATQAGTAAAPTALTAYYLSQLGKPAVEEAATDAAAGAGATAATEGASGINGVSAVAGRGGPAVANAPSTLNGLGSMGVVDSGFGLGLGPVSVPGVAAGAAVGYNQGKGIANILQDKKPSWLQHALLSGVTGGFDVLARPFLGGGKDKDQQQRDAWRGDIKENAPEFFDPNTTNLTLSSGATLDWGKDGRSKLQSSDGTDRHYFDVDFSRPDSAELAAFADPFGRVLGRGSEKGKRDATGYLINTAQEKGDPYQNLHEEAEKLGLDYNSVRHLISEMDIPDEEKNVHYNSLDDFFGVNAYAGKGPAWTRNHQQAAPAVTKPVATGTAVVRPGTAAAALHPTPQPMAKPRIGEPGPAPQPLRIIPKVAPTKAWHANR